MAAYFGWFTLGFIVLQMTTNFQRQQFWLLAIVTGIVAILNWLLRRTSPIKFQLNPLIK
ncbi:hypothetical protein GCM10025884_07570 [Leuconostoc gelidum subsp. gelidum]|nr:hypothetical protein GCM10025884_07570 [Leuconostoc gelidum subsp. gelidum]